MRNVATRLLIDEVNKSNMSEGVKELMIEALSILDKNHKIEFVIEDKEFKKQIDPVNKYWY